jgi:hypothetical protein
MSGTLVGASGETAVDINGLVLRRSIVKRRDTGSREENAIKRR